MKILQFGKFYPPDMGGIEMVMEDLTLGLSERGVKCDVLCSNSSRKYKEEILPCGAKIIRCASFGKLASTSISPQMITKLGEILGDYDIIHIHLPDPMANLALFLCKDLRGKILILHWHSDIIKQKNLLKLYAPLQTWLLNRSNKIICTSQKYIVESSVLPPYKDKCVCIPIGVDSESLVNFKIPQIRFPQDKKVIFSLGRMAGNKGFEFLVESARFLSDEYVICIGGSGDVAIENKLREIVAEFGLENKVLFLGRIERESVGYYYQNCHIFTLSSIQESYGIVLVEAMSFGKPVICTKLSPSGADWINIDKETGIVVPRKDAKAIANAIIEIEKNYDTFAKNARERYLEHFTKDKMIDKTLDLYEGF